MRSALCFLALTVLLLSGGNVRANDLQSFPLQDGTFLIDWRDEFSAAEKENALAWLSHMGNTVSLLHGAWPRERIRIALEKYNSSNAVVFGRILRRRPEGILFYINPNRPLQEFIASWTAYHEFGHLFIPYPGRADVWFSEGLASYYQNILQLRAGVLTSEEVSARFAAAYKRGDENNEHADLTLGELSADMRTRRAFMRVYWSGALYFMEADLALRQLSKPMTLDDVLRAYNNCCLPEGETRRGRSLAAEFDRLSNTSLFTELYDKYENSRAMPAWQTLLKQANDSGLLALPLSTTSVN